MTPSKTTEEDTEPNGAFSYPVEIHAFLIGVLGALADGSRRPSRAVPFVAAVALGVTTAAGPVSQAAAEPWYTAGGVVAGLTLVGLVRLTNRLTASQEEVENAER